MTGEPLSAQEREEMHRLFSHPFFIPKSFRAWMADQLALNIPQIPVSQAFGSRGIMRGLDLSTVSVTAEGTGDDLLYTLPMKGKQLAQNGVLDIYAAITAQTPDVANDSWLKFKAAGTEIGRVRSGANLLDGTPRYGYVRARIFNNGAYNVQRGHIQLTQLTSTGGTGIPSGYILGAVDTSVDWNFTLTHEWSSGSSDDIVVLKFIQATIFNPVGTN